MARRPAKEVKGSPASSPLGRLPSWFVRTGLALVAALLLCGQAPAALDELPLERWAKLREAERYQLNIAEKYYREQNWKVAVTEYEKFLSLYESSEGAAYAQLKWSMCQVNLRKLNTAIKDGYQSVIDYWPESPEAVSSAYLIARAYKDMGEIEKAKKAYTAVLGSHGKHVVAVLAKLDLIEIAGTQKDTPRQVELWKDLTYDTKREGEAAPYCVTASRQLAQHCFVTGAFPEGLKSLTTSYTEAELPYQVMNLAISPLWQLTSAPETKELGDKVAAAAIEYIQQRVPANPADDAEKAAARQYWFYIADLHSYARHTAEVGQVYEKVLQLYGPTDEVLGRLAGWFKATNRRDDARATYSRFANQTEGQSNLAYMCREEQKWDQAILIYQGLMSSDVEHADRWQWEIANAYRDGGRYKEAIASYRLMDNFPENLKQMAWCHRQLQEFKEAIGLYNQIIVGHEASAPWALLQSGYTNEAASEKETAIKTFQAVCRRFPKTGEASEAHAHLQNQYKITATLGGAKDE